MVFTEDLPKSDNLRSSSTPLHPNCWATKVWASTLRKEPLTDVKVPGPGPSGDAMDPYSQQRVLRGLEAHQTYVPASKKGWVNEQLTRLLITTPQKAKQLLAEAVPG